MGSYSSLYIDNFEVDTVKYGIRPEIATIFTEDDKKIIQSGNHKLDKSELWKEYNDDRPEPIDIIIYQNSVQNIIQRLEVMGFTLSHCQKTFETIRDEWIEERFAEDSKDANILKETHFESFIKAFDEARNCDVRKQSLWYTDEEASKWSMLSPLVKYILRNQDDYDMWFGFPCYDIRTFLRAFLETCSNECMVSLDVTDIVISGEYDAGFNFCIDGKERLIENYEVNTKVIILAEGSTDIQILKPSLELLYPHLSDYYSFMDFKSSKSPGSTSALVSQIKSFVGARIANRIVAVFDNDSAANAEINELKIAIPDNIKILTLPRLELANNYPTLGPSGIQLMDINGLACSIELYLGEDILKEGEEFIPIQWKGYIQKLKRYQGEIIKKKKVQKLYHSKLQECITNKDRIEAHDFSGMRLVLKTIFSAFAN